MSLLVHLFEGNAKVPQVKKKKKHKDAYMIVFNNSEDDMAKSAVTITYNTNIFEKEQTTMGLIFWTKSVTH